MKDKRAVSPLIATVLLIAFAVALGAVVMNWGHGQVQDTGACLDTEFTIEKIDSKPSICYVQGVRRPNEQYPSNTLHIMASNQGSQAIDDIKLSLITESGEIINPLLDEGLGAFETKKFRYSYNGNFGGLRKVRIIPIIETGTEETLICKEGVTEVISVPVCQD